MIEETKGTAQADGGSAESHGSSGGKGTEQVSASAESSVKGDDAKSETISRAEYNKLQADLDNFKRIEDERKVKEKKRQEELLKEQGKFRELYEKAQADGDGMRARLEKLDGVMKVMLEEEMKGLPEDFDKTLIPNGEPYDQVVWLKKAKAVIVPQSRERRGDGTPAVKPNTGLAGMSSIYNHPTSPKH